ncbi:hypothetical protein HPP92_023731 [Vanilla planifolia]|uniref:Uncharacterized protein n=1 Tax=Vanilla planifolia TaxID=51239 RepID=A0A835UCY2_VANPL|nr:hypothetical protein HPP92_024073 [Vanilla planifolia]KAG0455943.1 hypothetical protein HPP92_023731 [Vanilla planifolia]
MRALEMGDREGKNLRSNRSYSSSEVIILSSYALAVNVMGGRGAIGERWSQRILWICAIGSAISLYFVAVERQAQNRERMVAEGFSSLDGAPSSSGGEDI